MTSLRTRKIKVRVSALRRLALGVCVVAVLAAGPAWRTAHAAESITLNLKDADLTALISTVAEVTGRNFIIDPRVKGRVTVISKKPMKPDELYRVFLSILEVHGFSAVKAGAVTKIVPDINAKQMGIPTDVPPGNEPLDAMITQVVQVENVPVAQLVPILRPLVPQQGHLAAYPPTNVLIVSDRAGNIERLINIIHRVDQAGNDEIEVVHLQHASASELVRIIQSLQQTQKQNQPPQSQVQVAADERTNSILLSGDRSLRVKIRALIAQLDSPLDQGGNTQVVYLKYAKAKDLVPVLTGVSQNIKQAEAKGKGGAAQSSGGKDVDIQADEATNALVITAAPKVMSSLKAVIRQLDIRRAQILVDGAVAEVSVTKAAELGVNWGAFDKKDGVAGGSIFTNGQGNVTGLVDSNGNFNPGGLAAGLNLLVGDLTGRFQFGAFLRALASNDDTNILSTPSLVTLDNQEAEIRVAKNVPFVTGSYTNSGQNSTNPFQTIERQDVGLILKVKPQINEGDSVQLDIEQEASSVASDSQTTGLITNKRSIKTTVLVDDGQMLALGGLIDDQTGESEQKIPALGDIPLLGQLFKSRTSKHTKRNLMLFLQPTILRNKKLVGDYTNRKYDYIRAQQLQRQRKGIDLLPSDEPGALPQRDNPALPAPFGNKYQ